MCNAYFISSVQTFKKNHFFPLPPAPSPGYPQDPDPDPDPHEDFCPDPDPQKKMRIRNPDFFLLKATLNRNDSYQM